MRIRGFRKSAKVTTSTCLVVVFGVLKSFRPRDMLEALIQFPNKTFNFKKGLRIPETLIYKLNYVFITVAVLFLIQTLLYYLTSTHVIVIIDPI